MYATLLFIIKKLFSSTLSVTIPSASMQAFNNKTMPITLICQTQKILNNRWDHPYWADSIYIYCLKKITYNLKLITAYSLKMINYNLEVISYRNGLIIYVHLMVRRRPDMLYINYIPSSLLILILTVSCYGLISWTKRVK